MKGRNNNPWKNNPQELKFSTAFGLRKPKKNDKLYFSTP